MNRNDFQELARMRLREAQSLLDAGHYSGGYYLAGYAVECALKACIARKTRAGDFPDLNLARASYTHDLDKLAIVSGLREHLDDLIRSDRTFRIYWTEVSRWTPASRYEMTSKEKAEAFLLALTDPAHGVMQWLRRNY